MKPRQVLQTRMHQAFITMFVAISLSACQFQKTTRQQTIPSQNSSQQGNFRFQKSENASPDTDQSPSLISEFQNSEPNKEPVQPGASLEDPEAAIPHHTLIASLNLQEGRDSKGRKEFVAAALEVSPLEQCSTSALIIPRESAKDELFESLSIIVLKSRNKAEKVCFQIKRFKILRNFVVEDHLDSNQIDSDERYDSALVEKMVQPSAASFSEPFKMTSGSLIVRISEKQRRFAILTLSDLEDAELAVTEKQTASNLNALVNRTFINDTRGVILPFYDKWKERRIMLLLDKALELMVRFFGFK